MNNARRTILLGCLGLASIPVYAINFRVAPILVKANLISSSGAPFVSFLYQVTVLAIIYLIALRCVLRWEAADRQNGAVFVILFFAIVFRLLLVPGRPVLSTDIYRYVWDGRVQAHGINPYRYPPADKALRSLQDKDIYSRMNRQASPTIYPAGAQLLFRALNGLKRDSISGIKGADALFDTGSVLVLMAILSSLGMARERALIYAWHPLVVFECASSGHLDGFMLFFVLLSFLLMIRKRTIASLGSLALAASLKLYPAIILPAVLKEKKLRGLLVFSIVFLSLYLPYIGVGKKIVGFLPQYFENPDQSFNLGLKAYLEKLLPNTNPLVWTGLFAAILLCAAGWIWISHKDTCAALRFSYYLTALPIVFTASSLQPWYMLWIIPFLAIFPSPAWFYLSFAVCLSYLAYAPGQMLPGWEWVRFVEYVPFFVLLAAQVLAQRKSKAGWFPWETREKRQTSEF
ncbi:MAG: glycosyltransferase 87 family protein [Syntrophobacteraceae bacterium]|nr:glycosyltransferase 87 family protein [Syntrophobacteraceae bacterium]